MRVVAVLLVSIAAARLAAGPASFAFTSEEGRFVALFPAKPDHSLRTLPGPRGPQQKHYFTTIDGSSGFVVSYTDYPEPVTLDQVTQTVLAGAAKDGVKVDSTAKVSVGREPALRLRLRAPDGTELATLLVVSGNRFFQVTVSVRGGALTDRHLVFLSSFAIRPAPVPRPGG